MARRDTFLITDVSRRQVKAPLTAHPFGSGQLMEGNLSDPPVIADEMDPLGWFGPRSRDTQGPDRGVHSLTRRARNCPPRRRRPSPGGRRRASKY